MTWQVYGYQDYKLFNNEIGFSDPKIGIYTGLFGESYVISYGRKIISATYDLSVYNGLLFSPFAGSVFLSSGYLVHFCI